jgi:hypothetical protein
MECQWCHSWKFGDHQRTQGFGKTTVFCKERLKNLLWIYFSFWSALMLFFFYLLKNRSLLYLYICHCLYALLINIWFASHVGKEGVLCNQQQYQEQGWLRPEMYKAWISRHRGQYKWHEIIKQKFDSLICSPVVLCNSRS